MTLRLTEREAARLVGPLGPPITLPRGLKRDTSAEDRFAFQVRAMNLPSCDRGFKLEKSAYPGNVKRRWAFDFAFPAYWLLVEIDGGIWIRGAHGHPLDILRNMQKRNDAALFGYQVISFTPAEVKRGFAISFTQRVLAERGWLRNRSILLAAQPQDDPT